MVGKAHLRPLRGKNLLQILASISNVKCSSLYYATLILDIESAYNFMSFHIIQKRAQMQESCNIINPLKISISTNMHENKMCGEYARRGQETC